MNDERHAQASWRMTATAPTAKLGQVLALLAVLGASPVTRAAVITVDQVNCNLVDAITAANNDAPAGGCPAGSGEDTLRLTEAVYTLTQVNNGAGDFYTYDANGLPVITSPIVLSGERSGSNGSGVVIERSTAPDTPAFRLIDVNVGGSLVIQGVTLRNGFAAGGNVAPEGGGIRNAGRLRLIRSTVEGGRSRPPRGRDRRHFQRSERRRRSLREPRDRKQRWHPQSWHPVLA